MVMNYENLVLRNLGYINQELQGKIKNSHILIAGCGVGSSIAEAALRMGFINITLLDGDTVEEHNLNRQCYTFKDVKKSKAKSLAKRLKATGKEVPVELFFSNYEEVGHGGTVGYSKSVKELLVIDMGVLGDDCEGNEVSCSICAKDSSGPYDYEFRKRLVDLANLHQIPYKVDVYPFYSSDGSAALRAGNDFRVGLIGMGVAASHGTERTHKKGIEATIQLCLAFIGSL